MEELVEFFWRAANCRSRSAICFRHRQSVFPNQRSASRHRQSSDPVPLPALGASQSRAVAAPPAAAVLPGWADAGTHAGSGCQLRWKRRGEIKVSIRRHRKDIRHAGILSDTDLASTAQSTFAGRDFTLRGFLVEARIDRSHAYWHKAVAVQPSPFAADDIVGMKIAECYPPEEIASERTGSRDQLRELLARSTS